MKLDYDLLNAVCSVFILAAGSLFILGFCALFFLGATKIHKLFFKEKP